MSSKYKTYTCGYNKNKEMIYIVYKIGKSIEWDELRIFTDLASIQKFVCPYPFYVIAYDTDGDSELIPVCMYQMIKGNLQQFSL